jgi:hypothetical protein
MKYSLTWNLFIYLFNYCKERFIFQLNKCSKWPPSAWMRTLAYPTMENVTLRRTAATVTLLATLNIR